MGRYQQQQPLEPPASGSTSLLGLDIEERDLPELRQAPEPLDLLKWELTALKLEQAMDGRPEMEDAEMDVTSPMRKPGPASPQDDRPLGFDAVKKKHTISIQASAGTEDNPILASMSLVDNASSRLTKHNKALQGAVAVAPGNAKSKTVEVPTTASSPADKKAPQAHHSRPPLPPSKLLQFGVAPTPTPAKPQKDTTSSQAPSGGEQTGKAPDGKSENTSGRFQPIIIDTVERGDFLEPIIVHSEGGFTPPDDEYKRDARVESAFKHVRSSRGMYSIDALVFKNKHDYEEKIVSPCKNSALIKSAYHLATKQEGPDWPDELSVDPRVNEERSSLMVTPLSANPEVVEIVDLSLIDDDDDQLDADELEAEYARLVGEEGMEDSPTLSGTMSDGSESLELSETEEERSMVSPGPAKESETREDGKPRPLAELRKKTSMVVTHSSSDAKSTEGRNGKEPPRRVAPSPESPKEPEDIRRVDRVIRDLQVRETVRHHQRVDRARDPSGYQEEPPEARQAESMDHMHTASSEYDSQDHYEDEEERSDSEDKFYFDDAPMDTPMSQEIGSFGSKRKHEQIDYDLPSIQSMVAGYFGAGKKGITDGKTKAGLRRSLGCCLAFH